MPVYCGNTAKHSSNSTIEIDLGCVHLREIRVTFGDYSITVTSERLWALLWAPVGSESMFEAIFKERRREDEQET